ncbi:MAG: 4'-phosphopantetheinyl transferase superfamily protein [Actinobacteria bacterium]|nr:4'-phosphopantetheinyl transferase superfamily protein [Actinomycetota bacterium]
MDRPRPVPSGQAADVWWFDIRTAPHLPGYPAGLSAAERDRAAGLMSAGARRRYQAAHVLLRQVLAGYLPAGPAELEFGREPCPRCGRPSGRPVLAAAAGSAAPFPWFSLAHSGDAVVIAVAGRPVGVDAEQDPVRCVCPLAGAMHPADAAAMAGVAEPDRHRAIIRWWVRGEAALKCTGEGIAHRLGEFPVLTAAGALPAPADLAAPAGYQAALALAGANGCPAVTLAAPPPGPGGPAAGSLGSEDR